MDKKKVSIWYAIREFIWPRKGLIFLGLGLIVIGRLASLVIPWKSKEFLDQTLPNNDYSALKEVLVIICIAIVIQAVTSFLLTILLSVEAQNMIAKLRVKVQKKVLSLPVKFFDNNKAGGLVSRVMNDVEGVRNLVGTGLVQMVGGTITAVVTLIFLISISPMLTLFTLLPVSLFGLIALKAFSKIRPIFRTRGKINQEVTGRLTETLNGVRVIKGFNAEEQESLIFEKGVDKLFRNVKKSLTATAAVRSSGTFLLGITSAGVIGIGGYFVMFEGLSKGELIQFILFLGFLIAPIVQMSNIGSQLTEAFAGLDRTEELMSMISEDENPNRTEELGRLKGEIRFEDVSFAYEEEKEVVHNISFEASKGSVTALVGSSGSGKSTIAGLAASFITPDTGLVSIDGQDLSKVKLDSYRKNLGVVLQDDFLFEGTIRENILFPKPDATDEETQNAVKTAYVHEFTDRFEEGLDTLIGERGVKLSGGQKQRIAIARAVLADPQIIILDEATSNLDTESELMIQKSLTELMKGRTTLVIAHRLSTIRQADQILVIEDGRIVERGTHDELIDSRGRYHQLYTYQSRI